MPGCRHNAAALIDVSIRDQSARTVHMKFIKQRWLVRRQLCMDGLSVFVQLINVDYECLASVRGDKPEYFRERGNFQSA